MSKYPYLVAEGKGKILGYAYVSSFKEREARLGGGTSIYVVQNLKRCGVGGRSTSPGSGVKGAGGFEYECLYRVS